MIAAISTCALSGATEMTARPTARVIAAAISAWAPEKTWRRLALRPCLRPHPRSSRQPKRQRISRMKPELTSRTCVPRAAGSASIDDDGGSPAVAAFPSGVSFASGQER